MCEVVRVCECVCERERERQDKLAKHLKGQINVIVKVKYLLPTNGRTKSATPNHSHSGAPVLPDWAIFKSSWCQSSS